MLIGIRIYTFKDGEMKLWSNSEKVYNILNVYKLIEHWYRRHPYAKRVSEKWICQDYRIDQQRPQRNVYSQAYIKLVSMSEMEKRYMDSLIKGIEKDIEYPTVYDDGEHMFYEKTIYCPNCNKRRKVLTSKTHCEFCGFEFDDALKCPKCEALNLKGSKECKECGYEFRKESFINNDFFEVEKNEYVYNTFCPICNRRKSKYFNVCQNCGFDFSTHKQCKVCKEWVRKNDNFCCHCGNKLIKKVKCNSCGNENEEKNNYCNYCGNKLK